MVERFNIDRYRVIVLSSPAAPVKAAIDIEGVVPFHHWRRSFRIFFFGDDFVYPGYDGYFSDSEGHLNGYVLAHADSFERIYAVLRTEQPVYGNFTRRESETAPRLRMSGFNITTSDEPVGEIEQPPEP